MINQQNLNALFNFVVERWRIEQKKERGEPKPWTQDKILQQFRFTCVHREHDKVTKWIAANWRRPHQNDPDLWFAMAVARYINWPPTLEKIGYPIPWRDTRVCKILNEIAGKQTVRRYMARSHKETPYKIERIQTQMSHQVFGGAYFLNSLGPKIESIVIDRLTPLWTRRRIITEDIAVAQTLEELYAILHAQFGFGSFMAGQVVADLKYVKRWLDAPDWYSWAVSGPGSKRGLNRLLNRNIRTPWREREWLKEINELQAQINPLLKAEGIPVLHAQDVQGICCCEWDKYQRVKRGEGRPKQKYPGLPDRTELKNANFRREYGNSSNQRQPSS